MSLQAPAVDLSQMIDFGADAAEPLEPQSPSTPVTLPEDSVNRAPTGILDQLQQLRREWAQLTGFGRGVVEVRVLSYTSMTSRREGKVYVNSLFEEQKKSINAARMIDGKAVWQHVQPLDFDVISPGTASPIAFFVKSKSLYFMQRRIGGAQVTLDQLLRWVAPIQVQVSH